MKKLLLLDFDTTLFKTVDFWNDFAVVFAEVSGQPKDKYINHYRDFIEGEGRLMDVNYDALLDDAHVAAEPVRLAAKTAMSNKSYMFDDALLLINKLATMTDKYDIAILTFGQPAFQNLKIEHAPEIAHLPVYITQELKNKYIASNFGDRQGILVDDKPGQELPDGWIEVTIDRTLANTQPPITTAHGIVRIATLDDVVSVISQ